MLLFVVAVVVLVVIVLLLLLDVGSVSQNMDFSKELLMTIFNSNNSNCQQQ